MLGRIVKTTLPSKIARKMRFVQWAASTRMMVLNFIVDVLPKLNTGSTKLIVKPTRDPVS